MKIGSLKNFLIYNLLELLRKYIRNNDYLYKFL